MHSEGMNNSGVATRCYWCLRHNRVETDDNMCAGRSRLGPYATAAEAEHALELVAGHNAVWYAEDARWSGEKPCGVTRTRRDDRASPSRPVGGES